MSPNFGKIDLRLKFLTENIELKIKKSGSQFLKAALWLIFDFGFKFFLVIFPLFPGTDLFEEVFRNKF